jgi:hypothetical protein
MGTAFNPKTAVYTPVETAKYSVDAAEGKAKEAARGIDFPIDGIGRNEYFGRMTAGNLCAIIAQTSNYKSGMMHFWEREAAKQLVDEGRTDECIIHVSVEELVEEQGYHFLARESNRMAKEKEQSNYEMAGAISRGEVQDWDRLKAASIKIAGIPIYRIGESLARPEDMPNLYISNMARAIESLVNGEITGEKMKPAAIFFDYLQAFPIDPEVKGSASGDSQRRLQVRQDIFRLRQAAVKFLCPVIVGVQAKQTLSGAPSNSFQLPGIYDGEESSAIAQRCERIITQWMPKMNHPLDTLVKHNDVAFNVTENMLWVKVAKQRGGLPSGRSWPCVINYELNDIRLMEA